MRIHSRTFTRGFSALFICILLAIAPADAASQPPKFIRTWRDFEASFLYKQLGFSNVKIVPRYRIYKDRNNNYIVALQLDRSGGILTERILPVQKVPSKEQNTGLLFFVLDFVFGDGAALNNANASDEITPHVQEMMTANGAQIGDYRVCLARDPWNIRAGFDVKASGAQTWDLPNPMSDHAQSVVYQPTIPDLQQKVDRLGSQLQTATTSINSLSQKLHDSTSQLDVARRALHEGEVQHTQLIAKHKEEIGEWKVRLDQAETARDIARSKTQYMEETEQGRIERFQREMASIHPTQQTQVRAWTLTTQDEIPPVSDSYVADLTALGFNPKIYRRGVEQKIKDELLPLTPSDVAAPAKANIAFEILPDGTPSNLEVSVHDPQADADLVAKIKQHIQYIVLSAAPFRPLSLYPVNSVRMNVRLSQMIREDNSYAYTISAEYADKPSLQPQSTRARR